MSENELVQLVTQMFWSGSVLGVFVGIVYSFWGDGK